MVESSDRIEELRRALGFNTLEDMAAELREIAGVRTVGARFSEWKSRKPSPEMLATISLLHPNPRACLKWLREGGEMPPVAAPEILSDDRATYVTSPELVTVLKSLAWDVVQIKAELKKMEAGVDVKRDGKQDRA